MKEEESSPAWAGAPSSSDYSGILQKCIKLLETSIKQGAMASPDDDYMNGFNDLMQVHVNALKGSPTVMALEEKLLGMVRTGAEQLGGSCINTASASSSDSAVPSSSSSSQPTPKKAKNPGQMAKWENPEAGVVFLSATNSKPLIPQLILDLSPNSLNLRRLPGTDIRYFSIKKAAESPSAKLVFFCPPLPRYNPLAIGTEQARQVVELHKLAQAVADHVKAHIIENKERNTQIVFTGFGSASGIAQLASIKLMFDYQLQLYRNRHRVISVGFGDIRAFSSECVRRLDHYAYDHDNHLVFSSTEAFLPNNVALHEEVTYVGRRVPIPLPLIVEKYQEAESPSAGPLEKYLAWQVFRDHAMSAFEAYEAALNDDRRSRIPQAIEALQEHFNRYRIQDLVGHIYVDCEHDRFGDETEPIKSNRLKCTVKDTHTKAAIVFYFQVYWPDDVHDINERFLGRLRALRQDQLEYVYEPAAKKPAASSAAAAESPLHTTVDEKKAKGKKAAKALQAPSVKPRHSFDAWARFFRAQQASSISQDESFSRFINPFFDDSVFFSLDGNRFHFGMKVAAEVLMGHLLSIDARTQQLVRVLFGPLDKALPYRALPEASKLFRAPISDLQETSQSLTDLVQKMFAQDSLPAELFSASALVGLAPGQALGDFTVTRLASCHLEKFRSAVPLADLAQKLAKPSRNCSHGLPAKQCPAVSLLKVRSPFWERMYRHGDIFFGFRGSSPFASFDTTKSDALAFYETIQGFDYDKIGSVALFEIVSNKVAYGNSRFVYQYTFYLVIHQDPQ